MSRLSAVVTTYNGRALLGECLSALLGQTRPPDELLVVDDASPEDDALFVRERFPGVRSLRLPRNLGHAGAAAAGIAATDGELFALVNNDAVPDPDWCEHALCPLADARVGSVATRLVRYSEPDRIDGEGDGYTVVGHAFKQQEREADPGPGGSAPAFSACAAAAVFRRSAYEAAGGLRPELVAYYDDVDLGFRLRLAGYVCVYEPRARCRHRVSASYGRSSWRQLYLSSRNATLVHWADMPASLLVRRLPEHALFFALQILRRALAGGLLPFLAGKFAVLARLQGLVRLRRRAQERRVVSVAAIDAALTHGWLRLGLRDFSRLRRSAA